MALLATGNRGRNTALALSVGLVAVAVTGCATMYVLRPVSGAPVGVARANGLMLRADADAWDADPYDLPEYMTPIAVTLVNHSAKPVAVNYAAFSLLDEHGFRYGAIDPYTGTVPRSQRGFQPGAAPPSKAPSPAPPPPPAEPQQKKNDEKPEPPSGPYETRLEPSPSGVAATAASARLAADQRAATDGVLLAYAGDPRDLVLPVEHRREVHVARRGSRGGRAHVYGRHGGRGAYRVHRGHGYYVAPRVYRWYPSVGFGFYYDPWPGPWYYPPYYHTYVYDWGPTYYPARPTYDVRRLGLPEGVLKPGGEVSGFLYFQHAVGRARRLTLVWHAATPQGEKLARLSIAFAVVPD